MEFVEEFLSSKWPTTVIELGTGTGAFSTYLASYCAFHGYAFHTFDTQASQADHQMPYPYCLVAIEKLGGTIHRADVFDPATIEDIRVLIQTGDPTFLYCDDGDKPRELRTYAPLLRDGDWLGVHDVGTEVTPEDLRLPGFKIERIEEPNALLLRDA